MLNKELSRLNRTSANKTMQHTTPEPLTFEEVIAMLTFSEDIARTLPIETAHKLWDCYIDMIGEVKERLANLYQNLLIEFHNLFFVDYMHYPRKGDYKKTCERFSRKFPT